MPRLQSSCEEPKRWNDCKIDIVLQRDKLRTSFRIQFGDRGLITRIDLGNTGGFVNNLRLVIAHFLNFVRDLVEVRLADDHSNQFISADLHSVARDLLRRAPLVRERIEWKL